MDPIIAQLSSEIYKQWEGRKTKKVDLSLYHARLTRVVVPELIAHHLLFFPGDYCRKFMLLISEYWYSLMGHELLGIFDLLEENELAKHYLLRFYKRYLDTDCRNYIKNGRGICLPECYISEKETQTELTRLQVNLEHLQKAQETLQNMLLVVDIQRKVEKQYT